MAQVSFAVGPTVVTGEPARAGWSLGQLGRSLNFTFNLRLGSEMRKKDLRLRSQDP